MTTQANPPEELAAMGHTIQAWHSGEAWAGSNLTARYGPPGGDKERIVLRDYQQDCFYSTEGVAKWKKALKRMHAGPADTKEDVLIRTACCAHSMCELIRCMYQDKAHMLDMHRAITISFQLASHLPARHPPTSPARAAQLLLLHLP